MPWRQAAFAVVDLELTGLDPRVDEIVSWCAVPIDDGAIDVGAIRGGHVRTARGSAPAAIRVHGLRDGDVDGAPAGRAALEPLAQTLAGRVLVAHVAWVERAFLRAALGRRRVRRVVDTDALARHAMPAVCAEPAPIGLGRLAEILGLPVHAPHTAAGDALTTAQVFLALATRIEGDGPLDVRSLLRSSAAAG